MKILFLQEYYREDHFRKDSEGEIYNSFFYTKAGKILKQLVESKDGMNLSKDDYYIDYAVQEVPMVLNRDKWDKAVNYKQPSEAQSRHHFENLRQRIVEEKPDMVVPTGNLGCIALMGRGIGGITTLRGRPVHKTIESEAGTHDTWVLPTFSIEYMKAFPEKQGLVEADFVTIGKYVAQGESLFEISKGNYEFVSSMERVRSIFANEVKQFPVISWDLETNSLKPYIEGSKALVLTLSWEEGQGVTIPVEHRESPFTKQEADEIYELIGEFVADPDVWKVFHGGQFDARFLMMTKGFMEFNNHMDTLVMYYLLVNQSVESSLRLSDLAFEMTSMGGYDEPLEQWKKTYKKEWVEEQKQLVAEMREEESKRVKEEQKLENERAKQEGRKAEKIKKKTFTTPTAKDLRNEVDGGDFNYDWIPLREIMHDYAAGDTDACLRIFNKLNAIGERFPDIKKLYTEFYPQFEISLARMETTGIQMDVEYNKQLEQKYEDEKARILNEIRELPEVKELEEEHLEMYQQGLEEMKKPKLSPARMKKDGITQEDIDNGNVDLTQYRDEKVAKLRDKYKNDNWKFNPNADHKNIILYRNMGYTLPFGKETIKETPFKEGLKEDDVEWHHYKADADALERLKQDYPENAEVLDKLLLYALITKRHSAYTYSLRENLDKYGRVHAGFKVSGTASSRISVINPAMQTIPKIDSNIESFDYQNPIKRMFISRFDDGAILGADYSSLESRVLALVAGDEKMTDAFLEGVDMHSETASMVNNIDIEEVSKDLRQQAKAVTFGE